MFMDLSKSNPRTATSLNHALVIQILNKVLKIKAKKRKQLV